MTKRTILLTTLLFLLACLPLPVQARSMKIKSKMIDRTTIKISWKGSKDMKYWRIRRAVSTNNGSTKFKTVKILKRAKKSFVIKNLKKNREYSFEITGGKKVKGKYKPLLYDYVWSFYTGMSTVCWDDYAFSDAPHSPSCIELWGGDYCNGLPIKGFQIYRKEKGGKKYKKIKTIKKNGFPYKDKTVKAGKTYYYKFRAYGKYKKKILYSPFSERLTKSAVNRNGSYTSKIISSSQDRVEFSLTSHKYNGILSFNPGYLHITSQEGGDSDDYYDYYDYPIFQGLFQTSKDGVTWKTAKDGDKIQLKGGETIYCAIESLRNQSLEEGEEPEDMTKIHQFEVGGATYNWLPVYFSFGPEAGGSIYYDMEAIH